MASDAPLGEGGGYFQTVFWSGTSRLFISPTKCWNEWRSSN